MYVFCFPTPQQPCMNKFVKSTDKYDGDDFFTTVDGVKVRVCDFFLVFFNPSTTMSEQVCQVDRQI